MERIHFLNVKNGDCTIIEHKSDRVTMIDVNNGHDDSTHNIIDANFSTEGSVNGNFKQKKHPSNPIDYLKAYLPNKYIIRFINTHPDMDHLSGISRLANEVSVGCWWIYKNEKSIENFNKYNNDEDDWNTYLKLKNSKDARHFLDGSDGDYYNKENDNLKILAPTQSLIDICNESEEYNDCSYVILHEIYGIKILFCGDSHDNTWEHILKNYEKEVSNIDILFAPHHGRNSDRDWKFLDVLKPKITLIGNAPSKNIAYKQYSKYGEKFTNNQGGNFLIEIDKSRLAIYCSNKKFAQRYKLNEIFKDHHQLDKILKEHPGIDKILKEYSNLDKILEEYPELDKILEEYPEIDKILKEHPEIDKILKEHPELNKTLEGYYELNKILEKCPELDEILEIYSKLEDYYLLFFQEMSNLKN